MRIAFGHTHERIVLDVHPQADGYRVSIDGAECQVTVRTIDAQTVLLTIDESQQQVSLVRDGHDFLAAVGGEVYRFVPGSQIEGSDSLAIVAAPEITAPMPGRVIEVLARIGERVEAGQGLLILEAMKMETRLVAEAAGTVTEIRVAAGEKVAGGTVLIVLDYESSATSR